MTRCHGATVVCGAGGRRCERSTTKRNGCLITSFCALRIEGSSASGRSVVLEMPTKPFALGVEPWVPKRTLYGGVYDSEAERTWNDMLRCVGVGLSVFTFTAL